MNTVPRPGPVYGLYPQRPESDAAWLATPWRRWWSRLARAAQPAAEGVELLAAARASQAAWSRIPERNLPVHLHRLRARLGREGWRPATLRAQALGCVAALMEGQLRRNPFDTQLRCADLLLSGCLAEMATGEGKTLAVALAAAVAALAGVPVHVMTANDYLAQRDAEQLTPFFQALGLRVGVVVAASSPEQRRAAYACELTYCTAREVAFDHLRDRQHLRAAPTELQQRVLRLTQADASNPPPLLLRGLCMALVDEADSLLIDEATMPLVLAEAVDEPRHRAWCFQALALARELQLGVHAQLDRATHEVRWTEPGQQHLEQRAAALGGAWLNRNHRLDLVGSAVVALHALKRDEHYLVNEQGVQLLDAHTGRKAEGRVWSRGLQSLVELKEGLKTTPPTRTSAQTSYQRFFSRYLHLAGTSGTLLECRRELSAIYGLSVVSVPLRMPCRRVCGPDRQFTGRDARNAALVQRVRGLQAQGRPVLVGVATVAQAQRVSAQLQAAGVPHRVLDARHDAGEAAIVAKAGHAGQVTVATAMAGRGTDIDLGPGVAERGGLHVIVCQDNRSARLDRQFIGRCARQGDPGSAELWHAHDAPSASAESAGAAPGMDDCCLARRGSAVDQTVAPRPERSNRPSAPPSRIGEGPVMGITARFQTPARMKSRHTFTVLAALCAVWPAMAQGPAPKTSPLPIAAVSTPQAPVLPISPAPAAAPSSASRAPARPTVGCLIGPEAVADIGSPVTALVASVAVERGDSVRAGQTLVQLQNEVERNSLEAARSRASMDADILAAEANVALARQRHTRAVELVAQGFTSPQTLEQALAERQVAEQKLRQARSQKAVNTHELGLVMAQLNQRTLKSPFNGVVIERFVSPGERAEDKPLLRLAMLNPLRVELVMPATRWGSVAIGDPMPIVPELPAATTVVAKVTHIDKIIDAASNTFRVRLSLPNPGNRLPGARCRLDAPDPSVAAAPRG